jgi:hypothetical protein
LLVCAWIAVANITSAADHSGAPQPPEPFVIDLMVERDAVPIPEPFTIDFTVVRQSAPATRLAPKLDSSRSRKACPGGHMCGGLCCPNDVPCWDRMAIHQAVQEGRCR